MSWSNCYETNVYKKFESECVCVCNMDFVQIQMNFLLYVSVKTYAEFSCLVNDPARIVFHVVWGRQKLFVPSVAAIKLYYGNV